MLELDKLIITATKEGDTAALNVYRAIKAAELEQSKAANSKPLDEAAEIQIIKKLASQHEESIGLYRKLADEKAAELDIMKDLLPPEVSKEDIIATVIAWAVAESNGETIPKNRMGEAIKAVKAKFPTADGKLVADAVKERLA